MLAASSSGRNPKTFAAAAFPTDKRRSVGVLLTGAATDGDWHASGNVISGNGYGTLTVDGEPVDEFGPAPYVFGRTPDAADAGRSVTLEATITDSSEQTTTAPARSRSPAPLRWRRASRGRSATSGRSASR